MTKTSDYGITISNGTDKMFVSREACEDHNGALRNIVAVASERWTTKRDVADVALWCVDAAARARIRDSQ